MAAARVKLPGNPGGPSTLEVAFLNAWRLHGPAGAYLEPQQQFRFHPVRMWRFDFAWPAFSVAVEIQGGQWTGGRHGRGGGQRSDCEKSRAAALDGWIVLPFVTDDIDQNPCGAIDDVVTAIELVNRRRAAMRG